MALAINGSEEVAVGDAIFHPEDLQAIANLTPQELDDLAEMVHTTGVVRLRLTRVINRMFDLNDANTSLKGRLCELKMSISEFDLKINEMECVHLELSQTIQELVLMSHELELNIHHQKKQQQEQNAQLQQLLERLSLNHKLTESSGKELENLKTNLAAMEQKIVSQMQLLSQVRAEQAKLLTQLPLLSRNLDEQKKQVKALRRQKETMEISMEEKIKKQDRLELDLKEREQKMNVTTVVASVFYGVYSGNTPMVLQGMGGALYCLV